MMRLIDAFRVLEVIHVLTVGGPGDSTENLGLHIYKTAFEGQQLGVASHLSAAAGGGGGAVLGRAAPVQPNEEHSAMKRPAAVVAARYTMMVVLASL